MSGKYALIIANTEYNDASLAQLTAPGRDAEDFARVLRDKDIGAFDDVKILLNNPEPQVREAVDEFFDQKKHDDLLVLYFSGHGVRDEMGSLYLALKNTTRARLRATALKSDFIREMMDQTHSKRVVLILDCCNSGAFAQGTKAMTGGSVGTASAFEGTGYGRIVLTASDSTQFAWEGDKVIGGDTQNSLFTHFLVKGLEGEADHDFDGRITVDELFDYAYEQIVTHTPKQTPGKWSYKQQGEIFLRQSAHTGNIKPVSLPDDLLEAIDDTRTFVREGAVGQLEKLAKGKNLGLARVAREALDKIAKEDDSRRVAQIAAQALEAIRQAEQIAAQKAEEERLAREKIAAEQKAEIERKAKEEEHRLAMQKVEEERLARKKLEAEQKAEAERKLEEAQRLAMQKAKEERLALEKAEAERKAKEEAQRLAAQKAEEERLARIEIEKKAEAERLVLEKAKAERKAKEEAQRLTAQKAEEERLAREKLEAEQKVEAARKAKEEAQRVAAQKAEEEQLAHEKMQAEQKAEIERKAMEEVQRLAVQKADAERKAKEEAQRFAAQKAEEERLARKNVGVEHQVEIVHKAEEEAQHLPVQKTEERSAEPAGHVTIKKDSLKIVLWITLYWTIVEVISMSIATISNSPSVNLIIFGLGMAIGGLSIPFVLWREHILSDLKSMLPITFGWILGFPVGFLFAVVAMTATGSTSTALSFGLIFAISGASGGRVIASTLERESALSDNKKSMLWITLGWAIGLAISGAVFGAIGNTAKGIDSIIILGALIGFGIGTAIGGTVMVSQLRKARLVVAESEIVATPVVRKNRFEFYSWQGRTILGLIIGVLIYLVLSVASGNILGYLWGSLGVIATFLIMVIVGGITGLIAYPHKATIFILILSYFFIGITSGVLWLYLEPGESGLMCIFVAIMLGFLCLPLGALGSRIFFWILHKLNFIK